MLVAPGVLALICPPVCAVDFLGSSWVGLGWGQVWDGTVAVCGTGADGEDASSAHQHCCESIRVFASIRAQWQVREGTR